MFASAHHVVRMVDNRTAEAHLGPTLTEEWPAGPVAAKLALLPKTGLDDE
jgi:hypothetical protein